MQRIANQQEPLNRQAAQLLKQTDWTLDRPTELATATLMLWGLAEELFSQEPLWAMVQNYSNPCQDWRELISDLEQHNPELLMEYLTETGGIATRST
ncbi:MAG TPA: hypothetical protein VIU93_08890 [Gallionellaceae bacterium]